MMSLTAERRSKLAAIALIVGFCMPAAAQEARREYIPAPAGTVHAIPAEHGMVVAQERIGAQIGADILRQGGNAVDAAVATGFALAVTYPRAGNIGGGGFMVIHSAERKETLRSTIARPRRRRRRPTCSSAPTASPISPSRAIPRSASACPAPSPASLWRWRNTARDTSRWRTCSSLSIDLARGGFVIADDMADTLPGIARRLARWPASAKIFSRPDGASLREGDRLIQSDLAATLSAIAEQGPQGFYQGPVAEKLAAESPRRRRHHDVG